MEEAHLAGHGGGGEAPAEGPVEGGRPLDVRHPERREADPRRYRHAPDSSSFKPTDFSRGAQALLPVEAHDGRVVPEVRVAVAPDARRDQPHRLMRAQV